MHTSVSENPFKYYEAISSGMHAKNAVRKRRLKKQALMVAYLNIWLLNEVV